MRRTSWGGKVLAFGGIFGLLSMVVSAQTTTGRCLLTLRDADSKQPLSEAIVRVRQLGASEKNTTILLSDKNGQLQIQTDAAVQVMVSYLSYQTYTDTLQPNTSKVFGMVKQFNNTEEVVVTGQYLPNATRNSVYEVKVLTEKDFRTRGASNLREALQGNLNIDATQDAVFGSGISLQGISGEGVKIMVDGVPLVGRLDGKLDLSQISLSNIEKVEIVKGPLSVVYGTDAMGGVINLITKSGQQDKYSVNLKAYYETVGQYNIELNGGVHWKKSQFYLSGSRNFFDGFSAIDTSRHKDWRPKEQYTADLKYSYTASRFRISTTLSFFRELMLDRGNLVPGTTYAFDQHFTSYRPRATVAGTVFIKDFSQVDFTAGYSGFIRFLNNYTKDLNTMVEKPRKDESQDTAFYHQLTARATYTVSTKKQKASFQFGIDLNQEWTKQLRITDGSAEMGDFAAFAGLRWKPVPQFEIQPAARISYNTRFRTPIVPSLNIKSEVAPWLTLRASYGLGYRSPSLKELFLQFKDSNHDINGNTNLKPEQGHNVQASVDFTFNIKKHQIKWMNSGFFNLINNKIDLALTNAYTSPVTYQYFNLKSYR
ncbi:MAG: TonB-dependent receptor, partial [Chitinophagales bacterium]